MVKRGSYGFFGPVSRVAFSILQNAWSAVLSHSKFRSCIRTRSSRSRLFTGLATNSLTPRSMAAARVAMSSLAVSKIIGIEGVIFFSSWQTSSPSIAGIITSKIMRPTRCRLTISRHWCPLDAPITDSPCLESSNRRNSNTPLLSSTTRIVGSGPCVVI
jgi:hypothetical protein